MLMKTVVGATLALAITAAPVGTAPAKPAGSTAPLTEAAAQSVELPYETLGLCLRTVYPEVPKTPPLPQANNLQAGVGF